MRFRSSLLLLALPSFAGSTYYIAGDEQSSWPAILSSVGFTPALTGPAAISAIPAGVAAPPAVWLPRIEGGAIVVIEGESELAAALGIVSGEKRVEARSAIDLRAPDLPIIWEKTETLPVFGLPVEATLFVRERWTSAPLMAGVRRGKGAVLWLATSPGKLGYERFPYTIQALIVLGLDVPYRSNQLWAFFDSSYRLRADPDYLAARWRKSGIATLHVAAWHYYDRDPQRDQYLAKLIEACHRRTITVYAWLELPHVSEKFWIDHPEWREQTAAGQDAHLDWRKLMNLQNRDCFAAVSAGLPHFGEAAFAERLGKAVAGNGLRARMRCHGRVSGTQEEGCRSIGRESGRHKFPGDSAPIAGEDEGGPVVGRQALALVLRQFLRLQAHTPPPAFLEHR